MITIFCKCDDKCDNVIFVDDYADTPTLEIRKPKKGGTSFGKGADYDLVRIDLDANDIVDLIGDLRKALERLA